MEPSIVKLTRAHKRTYARPWWKAPELYSARHWAAALHFNREWVMPQQRDVQTTRAERRTAAAKRSAPELRTMSDRDVDVLRILADARSIRTGPRTLRGWATVGDVGGSVHSHHANTLVKLARNGLAQRKWIDGKLRSRITDKGKRVLAAVRKVQ